MTGVGKIGALVWLGLALTAGGQEKARLWTSDDGRTVEAVLVEANEEEVSLKLASGQVSTIPLSRLSAADRTYVEEWRKAQPIEVKMPDVVEAPPESLEIQLVEERPDDQHYLYRTRHFEFDSQGKLAGSLMKEVARNFEATYELLKVMPWDIDPRPPEGDYFRASLYLNRDEYAKAGGPANSGGVYMSGRKRFLVPFESLGLRQVGKAFRKDDDYATGTLVHELTHQMMHFWLPFLPQWVLEGTAEYCGALPLRQGRFRLSAGKGALKDYIDFLRRHTVQGVPEPYPLEDLFNISSERWSATLASDPKASHRLYFTSYLMVYFFMHMDGEGEGQRFTKYMRAVGAIKDKAEAYKKAMEEFRKNPEVKERPNGSLVFPSTLKPPEMPKELVFRKSRDEMMREHLKILLDGRSEADLLKEVRSGFQKLGIRL